MDAWIGNLIFVGLCIPCVLGNCNVSQFTCADNTCIKASGKCDGSNDCSDWSDETSSLCGGDCSYRDYRFTCANGKCITSFYTCDRDNDCGDYSDETGCSYCGSLGWFTCKNKRCIPYSKKCDRTNDCGDYSDELDPFCTASQCYRQCNNGKCLHTYQKCDGKNDCGDFTDEQECLHCRRDQYRCQLGKCIPLEWQCDGATDCPEGDDELYCECANETMIRCESGECIEFDQICDGKKDCSDESDENMCNGTIIHGRFGPSGKYNCNCIGECHPVTGICNGYCKDDWTGPTCQIERVDFGTPEQRVGDTIIQAPASVDGRVSTCPPVAIGLPSAWWEVNITQSVYLKRMRIYNKKDTSHLALLENFFRRDCSWNVDYAEIGYMDVACNVTVRTDRVLFLAVSTEEHGYNTWQNIPTLQICEFQVIVCSNSSFGVQCEKTCNCLNEEPCDDITGECKTGCQPGWTGTSCDKWHNRPISLATNQSNAYQVRPYFSSSCHCSDVMDCSKVWCQKGCKDGWSGIHCDVAYTRSTTPTTTPTSTTTKKSDTCHCKYQPGCPYSGCFYGCEDGWSGSSCEIEKRQHCHCLINNGCPVSGCDYGCQTGWHGSFCDVEISSKTCHCAVNFGCPANGCSFGCESGWYGKQCDQTSPVSTCHCLYSNGCPSTYCSPCETGWTGSRCDIEQSSTTTVTTSDCHCRYSFECEETYRTCPSGCKDGWSGWHCNTAVDAPIEPESTGGMSSWMISSIAVGVGLTTFICLCGIFRALVINRRRTNQPRTTRRPVASTWTTQASQRQMVVIRAVGTPRPPNNQTAMNNPPPSYEELFR